MSKVVDHLGNEYSSLSAMCRAYDIATMTYKYRISAGWSVEKALTTPSAREDTSCRDHVGNIYATEKEMCEAYGIKHNTFQQRRCLGWSLSKALTMKAEPRNNPCMDHMGNKFKSETEMCEYHNIDRKLYVRRKELGWSLSERLLPGLKNSGKTCVDHLGNEYRSYADMCRKYGLDWGTFKGRRERGWSLEEILTKEVGHTCQDHLGNTFESMTEMCREYKISFAMYQKRILDYGWTVEEALTIPKNSSLGEVRIANYLNYRNITYYHDITIKRLFKELGLLSLYEEYLQLVTDAIKDNDTNFTLKRISNMRFDFSLIQKGNIFAFIEYDGEQHFKWVDTFFKTLEDFLIRHNADDIKTKFSECGTIPLLRIRYDQVDYIPEMIDDLLSRPNFYLQQHNTFITNDEYWKLFNDELVDGAYI